MISKFWQGIILCTMITGTSQVYASTQLYINEVMQSNIHNLYVDNDFPDSWVELYNGSDAAVNLNGWKIGVSEKIKKAYTIDVDTVIKPGQFVTILCDKEEYGLHTSFRVESGSGLVVLYSPDGEVVDRVDHGKMAGPDISFGRIPDGGEEIHYLVSPTPGRTNESPTAKETMPEPRFSHVGGIYDQPFTLTVSMPEGLPEDASLCVTFDGTEPALSHAIEGNTLVAEIGETTILRARIISSSSLNPLSVTHSYLFETTDLPVVSITTNPEYLWSDSIGILNGDNSLDPNWAHEWRRPVNTELFLPDGNGGFKTAFNQLGETRLKGSSTRGLPQKSMVVYANKRFGVKRMDCTGVWPDKPGVTNVKSLELKNGGADFDRAHMRDPLANLMIGRNNPDVDWQGYRPAIVFFNGEYRGIFDIRERTNEDFIEANYDGLEDIDLVENWNEVKAGDIDALMGLYDELTDPEATFDKINSLVDFDNILPQYALNIFGSNYDSGGGNNTVMWHRLEGDTRWRLILKDVDMWGGTWESDNIDYDMFDFYIRQYEYSASVGKFRDKALSYFIVKDSVASQMLLDHLIVAMGDYLNPDYVSTVIDELKTEIEYEYPRYMAKYFPDNASWMGNGNWKNNVERLRKFAYERREFMYPYLAEYYGLGTTFGLEIIRDNDCPASINGISLSRSQFDGRYYHGRELRLTTITDYGFEVIMNGNGTNTVIASKGSELSLIVPDGVDNVTVKVTAIPTSIESVGGDLADNISIAVDGGIVKIKSDIDVVSAAAYNPSGMLVTQSRPGEDWLRLPSNGLYLIRVVTADGRTSTLKAAVR